MVDASKFFPDLYLSAQNLTKPARLTICEVKVERLKTERGEEDKIVLYFTEARKLAEREGDVRKERRLCLGKSLLQDFKRITASTETNDWIGRAFIFSIGRAIKGGKACLRAEAAPPVAAPTPPQAAAQPTEEGSK